MLLSVDWDAFSGTREGIFDAPIWGTPDRAYDRAGAWAARARRRAGEAWTPGDWSALEGDFPLYPGWEALRAYRGVPSWVTLSHAEAWPWLERFPGEAVLNVDSHHDLASLSGDPERLRPGNWAGLALRRGLIRQYTCAYPAWHAGLPVAEGYDLARTEGELAGLGARLGPDLRARVRLRRLGEPVGGGRESGLWPAPERVRGLLLVQSPAWTSPAHDATFWALAQTLGAEVIEPPLHRGAEGGEGAAWL